MIVLKIGGGENINIDFIAQDLVNILQKDKVIIVHGASTRRDEIAKQLGHETKVVESPSGISSVFTDEKAMEIFLMVYAGLINKQIVAKLQSYGINAVGLSGIDGRLWEGKRKEKILVKVNGKVKAISGNLTGKVEKINTNLLNLLIENHYVPVLCPPAISEDNQMINTDNDIASALLASQMNAIKLVMLFEAPGLLRDHKDESSLIKEVPKSEIENYLTYAKGRMKKKIIGVQRAIESGVQEIYWGDGRIENPISSALSGDGTIFK